MKHLNYYFIIMALAFVGLTTSCADDDPIPAPGEPTISVTVSPEGTEYLPGTELTFTINATPATGSRLFTLEVTPNPDGAFDSGLDSHTYNTSEAVTYKYIVPENVENVGINFKVTAVNSDFTLYSTATVTELFGVKPFFTEYNNIKLEQYSNTVKTSKSLVRWDTGETYSIQETIDGDNDIKLGIDMYPYFSGDNLFLLTPSQTLGSIDYLPAEWGDASITRQWASDVPQGFSASTLDFDDDDLVPSDITSLPGKKYQLNPIEGTVYAFDNAILGQWFSETEDQHSRNVNDVVGLMRIDEINKGTIGDGSDAYIVISIKVALK
jgi:hypothetical protein